MHQIELLPRYGCRSEAWKRLKRQSCIICKKLFERHKPTRSSLIYAIAIVAREYLRVPPPSRYATVFAIIVLLIFFSPHGIHRASRLPFPQLYRTGLFGSVSVAHPQEEKNLLCVCALRKVSDTHAHTHTYVPEQSERL